MVASLAVTAFTRSSCAGVKVFTPTSMRSEPSRIILGASAAVSIKVSANSNDGTRLIVMFCVTTELFYRISSISAWRSARVEEINPNSSEVTTPSNAAVIDAN